MRYIQAMEDYSIIKRKDQRPDTCSNVGESQLQYAKWEKPDSKEYITSDSIYTIFQKAKTTWYRK